MPSANRRSNRIKTSSKKVVSDTESEDDDVDEDEEEEGE